jgi:hypothetical protein
MGQPNVKPKYPILLPFFTVISLIHSTTTKKKTILLPKLSSSPRQRSIEKVEGEPIQEDVGGTQSEPLKMSEKVDGYSLVDYMNIPREEFVSKYIGWTYPDDPSKVQIYGGWVRISLSCFSLLSPFNIFRD